MKVRIIVGAQRAYAAITTPTISMDVALPGAKAPAAGLLQCAEDFEERAARYTRRVQLCRLAAHQLDSVTAPAPRPTAAGALEGIAELMNATEWNADTLDQIAELVRAAGYTIEDPEQAQ